MTKIVLLFMVGCYANAVSIEMPNSFKANFIQKVTNPKNKVLNYSGNVSFSDSTLLKWVYTKPTKKEVCTNGKELTVVDHDLEQASHYRINKGFDFAKILKSATLYKDNIYVTNYENKKYTIKIDKKKQLHSIAYFDNLDNKVQIKFEHVKYSKDSLSQKEMNCTIPKAYDIIKG